MSGSVIKPNRSTCTRSHLYSTIHFDTGSRDACPGSTDLPPCPLSLFSSGNSGTACRGKSLGSGKVWIRSFKLSNAFGWIYLTCRLKYQSARLRYEWLWNRFWCLIRQMWCDIVTIFLCFLMFNFQQICPCIRSYSQISGKAISAPPRRPPSFLPLRF